MQQPREEQETHVEEPIVGSAIAPTIAELPSHSATQNPDGALHSFDEDEAHFLLRSDVTRVQVAGSPLELVSFDPASGSAVIDNIYDTQPPFVLNQAGQLSFLPVGEEPEPAEDELEFEALSFHDDPATEEPPSTGLEAQDDEPAFSSLAFVEGSGLADLNLSFAEVDVFMLNDDLDVAELE